MVSRIVKKLTVFQTDCITENSYKNTEFMVQACIGKLEVLANNRACFWGNATCRVFETFYI